MEELMSTEKKKEVYYSKLGHDIKQYFSSQELHKKPSSSCLVSSPKSGFLV